MVFCKATGRARLARAGDLESDEGRSASDSGVCGGGGEQGGGSGAARNMARGRRPVGRCCPQYLGAPPLSLVKRSTLFSLVLLETGPLPAESFCE